MKKISLILVFVLVVSLVSTFPINAGLTNDLNQAEIDGNKNIKEKPNVKFLASITRTIERKGFVNVNALNVRDLASMDGSIIAVIDKSVQVYVFEQKDAWYHVEYARNKRGWVYAKEVNVEWPNPLRPSDLRPIEKKGFVNQNKVNIRSLGFDNSSIISTINTGVRVHVFGQKDGWYFVEYASNKRGWVYAKNINVEWSNPLRPSDLRPIEKKGFVNQNKVNVRSLGFDNSSIISTINKGVKVHVFGQKDGWYFVEYASNKRGWVYAKNINVEWPNPLRPSDLRPIEKKGAVNQNAANVRSLGFNNSSVITVINKGLRVHVFGQKDGWYFVEYARNKKGWVYAKEINVEWNTSPPSDLSNKSYSWYFVRKTNHEQPGFDKTYKALLDRYNGITIGSNSKKDIFLTFDNGYENGYTVKILDILKKQNVKVGFFVQGSYIDGNPDIVKRMVREGHIVLNHTNTHPEMPTLNAQQLKNEINITAEKHKRVTGKDMHKFLRPPSGVFSERTLAETKNLGYRTVFWSMAYRDWVVNDQPGKAAAYKHVTDNIHNGAVILLHSVSKSNTEALEDIIKELKRRGYNFKLLTQFP